MRIVILLLLGAVSVRGVTIAVTDTNDVIADDGFVSLREAVVWANTNAGLDTIDIPEGTYSFLISGSDDNALMGDLDVKDNTIIQGAGARTTIIDGNDLDRVMFFDQDLEIWMSDVTIFNGLTGGDGAGIYNQSTARLVRCQIVANGAFNVGGGIEQFSGAMYLDRCSIYFNACGANGSGGLDVNGGLLSVSNSTISVNGSPYGAGILRLGGEVQLFSCTIVSNEAANEGGGVWGGVTSMANTIVAANLAPVDPDFHGGTGSLGFNLIGNSAGANGTIGSDILDANAAIGSLRYRGGTTPTHALLAGSPAINRADVNYPTNDVAFDQRGAGFPRQRGVRVDIGAYEFPNPDEDADGMPDEWEETFAFDPYDLNDAGLDPDGDGFINADEYIADTLPTNGASFHHLIQIAAAGDIQDVIFPSSTARVYQLHASADLISGAWSNVSGSVTGMPGETSLSDTNALGRAAYRVSVRLP